MKKAVKDIDASHLIRYTVLGYLNKKRSVRQMNNRDVAEILRQIAAMLKIKGENVYKRLAYERAADNIEGLGQSLESIWEREALRQVPGIGKAIEAKIDELFRTGKMTYYEELQKEIPFGVVALMNIPGVGPKTARLIWDELGLTSLTEVAQAAQAGLLRDLPGLGQRSEARILEGIAALEERSDRIPLGVAWPVALEVMAALGEAAPVQSVKTAGSLRRMRETIGDIDILAQSDDPPKVLDAFVALPHVAEVVGHGPTKATVILQNGFQVDLRVLEPPHWGAGLQYFTGSQGHNVEIRELARKQKLSLSEYGFKDEEGRLHPCPEEETVYAKLGLAWIPPELRENRGEIEAAAQGTLPHLLNRSDLRGDLHLHTDWSDGRFGLHEMVQAAQDRGYRYMVISDHTESLGVANGLSWERIQAQKQEIERVQSQFPHIRILQGAEVEIKADGSLDFGDELLSQLDVVIASIHSGLRQPEQEITERAIRAMQNPYVDILGHPSGRLLGQREASALNLDRVLAAAAETGTILEINSTPSRLDLDDVHIRQAIQLGVQLTISSDAHAPAGLNDIQYGVATARRGWAEAEDILNTTPLDQLLDQLAQKSARRK
jgi:DNA polymerase (family 10)